MVVGLGNPGGKYEKTRHNAGFMILDIIAQDFGANFKFEKKFNAEIAQTESDGEKILLVKPMTFMNLSGQAVKSVTDYFKIDRSDVLVVFDDMDLPLGEMRLRKEGRSGGHNGLQSIMDEIGSDEILRLKLGIGRPQYSATQHVLENFSEEEVGVFKKTSDKAREIIGEFIRYDKLDNSSYSVV